MKNATQAILNRSFAEVTAAEIKAAIVAKFGSLAHFCRLTGRELQKTNDMLRHQSAAAKAYMEQAFADARRLCNQQASGYHLTAMERSKLKAALGRTTVVEFCSTHQQFTPVYVSRVTGGRTQKITPMVKELAKALNVELGKGEEAGPC